jgi:hypothetical protein
MLGLDLEQLIHGGGIGIAVLMILYSLAKDKMYNKTLNNHFKHFTDAIDRNTKAIGANSEVIKANIKILDRVENCLDKHKYH